MSKRLNVSSEMLQLASDCMSDWLTNNLRELLEWLVATKNIEMTAICIITLVFTYFLIKSV